MILRLPIRTPVLRLSTGVNASTSAEDTPTPHLHWFPASTPPRLVVLMLHGGRAHGEGRVRSNQVAYLRVAEIGARLARGFVGEYVAVAMLRNRVRGWNEPRMDPVLDARWALERVRERHPGVPVALIGHSMGGRAALRLAGAPDVSAVCALAPWIEAGEPVAQLAGRTVVIAHGDRDRWTDARASRRYADRADVTWLSVPGSGHAMLRRTRRWHAVLRDFLADALAVSADPAREDAR
jgi:alpha-beta hydrolase superfamily lysophospholipase